MDKEVGHPQHLAAAWHGISFLGRLRDFKKSPNKWTGFWLTWEVIGVGWSLLNLYHLQAEREEARMEDKLRNWIDK